MKILLKDSLLKQTSDIQRTLQKYNAISTRESNAASFGPPSTSSGPCPTVDAVTGSSSESPQIGKIASNLSSPSAAAAATAVINAVQNYHSVSSRLLPLSVLGDQSQLPLHELSALQSRMHGWRSKYQGTVNQPPTSN